MESATIILDTSSSSIVASVISDDKNVTSFGSLEKFLHLKHNTNAMYKIPRVSMSSIRLQFYNAFDSFIGLSTAKMEEHWLKLQRLFRKV